MKRFFFFSLTAHGVILSGMITLATLLSRPRMSYYAVDLLSAVPSVSSGGGSTVVAPENIVAPRPETVPEVPREAIRVVEKNPKKHPVIVRPPQKPAVKTVPKVPSWAVADSLASEDTGKPAKSGSALASGASATAGGGVPFPYPWYLKTVTDRLEKQWQPKEFQNDTRSQVVFIIHPDGQISGAKVSKPSGDAFFDQLALRAVLNAGTMPPLPTGFREPQLRVYMTFEGKK